MKKPLRLNLKAPQIDLNNLKSFKNPFKKPLRLTLKSISTISNHAKSEQKATSTEPQIDLNNFKSFKIHSKNNINGTSNPSQQPQKNQKLSKTTSTKPHIHLNNPQIVQKPFKKQPQRNLTMQHLCK